MQKKQAKNPGKLVPCTENEECISAIGPYHSCKQGTCVKGNQICIILNDQDVCNPRTCDPDYTTSINARGANWEEIPSCIQDFKKLKYLDAGQNQITRVENIDGLERLKELALDYNHITKIEGLNDLPSLKKVNLYHNPIDPAKCNVIKERKAPGTAITCPK